MLAMQADVIMLSAFSAASLILIPLSVVFSACGGIRTDSMNGSFDGLLFRAG